MMDNVEVKTKRCSKCGRFLPLADFNKRKRSSDGLDYWCKECQKAYKAEYYQSNRDSELKKQADYYQAHKDEIQAYNTKYYQANKEAILKYQSEYRAKNKEAIAQRNAIYYDPQKNPRGWAQNIVSAYRKMDRERGFDDSQTITTDWFLDNIAYKPCKYCGKQGIGLVGVNRKSNALGHIPSNCESCCSSCNSRQNCKDMLERGLHVSCKGKARHKTA